MYIKKEETLKYEIDAKDPKYENKLLPKYGEILGLNTDNIKRIGLLLSKLLVPKLEKYISI